MAGRRKADISRLCQAADTSRHVMQFFREERMRGVRHLAGHRYSTQGADKKTYVNLISLYCNIVGRNLYAKNPRIALSTFDLKSRPAVTAMETWINDELERSQFSETMQRIVLDAMFAIGIAKVGIASPAESASFNWKLQPGEAFVDSVDLDDFVFDHHARRLGHARFMGHRIRVPFESVKDSTLYNKKARDRLVPSEDVMYNKEGDERISAIGRDYHGYEDECEDMIDLWEIWYPSANCVITVTEDDLSGPTSAWEDKEPAALREQDWVGPDSGPYHFLPLLGYLPGNPFPKGPIQDIVELHEAANESYRKCVRQAANQKDMVGYDLGAGEDAVAIQKTNDGGMVGLRNPKSIVPIQTGGVNQSQALMMQELIKRFMEFGGNLTTMGGLAPQAGTLGQEELLAQQSNGQVASMQDATAAFVTAVSKDLLWWHWHNPYKVMVSNFDKINLPGIEAIQEVHPWDSKAPGVLKRDGEMPRLKIDPYSMRYQTPQQRASGLTDVVTKIFIPMAQLAQQQGIVLDFNEFLGILGKNMDLPDLQRILTVQEPPALETTGGAGGQGGGMPGETTRNYNRNDVGRPSQRAEAAETETMMEAGPSANGKLQKMPA